MLHNPCFKDLFNEFSTFTMYRLEYRSFILEKKLVILKRPAVKLIIVLSHLGLERFAFCNGKFEKYRKTD